MKTRWAAINALEERLDADRLPSAAELEIIFASLPDAADRAFEVPVAIAGAGSVGPAPHALEIATRANRRGWKLLENAINADWVANANHASFNGYSRKDRNVNAGQIEDSRMSQSVNNDAWLERILRKLAPLRAPEIEDQIKLQFRYRRGTEPSCLLHV
jgi:hypothetical protein